MPLGRNAREDDLKESSLTNIQSVEGEESLRLETFDIVLFDELQEKDEILESFGIQKFFKAFVESSFEIDNFSPMRKADCQLEIDKQKGTLTFKTKQQPIYFGEKSKSIISTHKVCKFESLF